MNCLSCQAPLPDGAFACSACGAPVGARRSPAVPAPGPAPSNSSSTRGTDRPAPPSPRPFPAPRPAPRPSPAPPRAGGSASRWKRLAVVLVAGLAGGGALATSFWWFKVRPRLARIENPMIEAVPKSLDDLVVSRDGSGLFDRTAPLPAGPNGLGTRPGLFVVASRTDPWGFLRLSFDGDGKARVESVAVIEPRYLQKMGLDSVTWNGTNWVGLTSGSWFGDAADQVFTFHDPETLQVVRRRPAPDGIGAMAWDGTNWWAGSRKNTVDADEPKKLYRLDAAMNVTGEFDAPGPGCQGLAFDGALLYWADVFDDAIHALRIEDGEPRLVASAPAALDYLSGLGWDGTDLWVAEYGDNTLRRVRREQLVAWRGSEAPAVATAAVSPAPTADPALVADLQAKLRGSDRFEAMRAESELSRLGQTIPYARRVEDRFDDGPESTDLIELVAELKGNDLYVSWDLWIGPQCLDFSPGKGGESVVSVPRFAKYRIDVESDALASPIRVERDASAGRNVEREVRVAGPLGPGEYNVSVFIHVQYTKPDGTPMILNDNAGFVTVTKR